MDPLMPLTAAVVTKDLEPQKRLALTGAALVLNGPLALAPALVAAERARRAPPPPVGGAPIGPELVKVPDVVGQTLDEARKTLTGTGLSSSVTLNRSGEEQKDQVLTQDPTARAEEPVEKGSTVALRVGAGPGEPGRPNEHAELLAALRDIGSKVEPLQDIGKKLESIDAKLDSLATANPPPPENKRPQTSQTSSKPE